MPYLGKWGKWGLIWLKAFCAGIWKYYCHTWNERPRISWIIEFGAKMKIVKFGTKDTLFLGCNLKNVLSCLRLTPSNFSKSKIKIFKYRIWLFLAWDFLKSIVIFEISIPEFKKCEFLTHTVNFSTRSIFPKGLRPTFSKDPGRGPGLLYQVCCMRISIMIGWTAQKMNFPLWISLVNVTKSAVSCRFHHIH